MRFPWVGQVLGKLVSHVDNVWPHSLMPIVELANDGSLIKIQ
jgi:hypothetical protein